MAVYVVAFGALCVSLGTAATVFILVRLMAPSVEVRYIARKLEQVESELLEAKLRVSEIQRKLEQG